MTETRQRRIQLKHLIHLLPAFILLMVGSGICVPESEIAAMLKFWWARPMLAVSWFSILIYFAVGFWLRRSIGANAWIASFCSAAILFAIPPLMVSLNTRSLGLAHYLQPAEMTALKANFPFPYFHYTSNSDGPTLVVRKSDYSESLMDYLRTNHLVATK